jgi:hypothetical protein
MRLHYVFLFFMPVFLLGVNVSFAEEWLQKGDSKVLGHKVSDQTFKTCNNTPVDLSKIQGYTITQANETCGRPKRIDGLGDKKEKAILDKMQAK